MVGLISLFFFFQAEDGIRDLTVTGVQTCALPISVAQSFAQQGFGILYPRKHFALGAPYFVLPADHGAIGNKAQRSEEHTSELQSQSNLVCRLLLEKKKEFAWK